ncbi:uncharacterized protein LOC135123014 [Zophobas morio]|uniref:uncharacterized protein LOC135123014 n=1 Tax=Zophobas morio TaxID=2755281 RepID=UPI003082C745
MLHRRLQTINNIKNDLDKNFLFPREIRKKSSIMMRDFVKNDDLRNISDKHIQSTVESVLQDCLRDTENLGMKVIDFNYVFLPPCKDSECNDEVEDEMFSEEQCDHIENYNNSQIAMKRNCFQSFENDPVDQDEDLLNDLCTISYECKKFDRDIHLRSFDSDDIFVEKGYLVRIRLDNTTNFIKKSSLCWLLDNEKDHVSVDRLKRFIQKKKCNSSRVNSETDTCLQHKDASQIQKPVQIGKQKRRYNISSDSSDLDNPSSIEYDDSTDTESLNSSNYSDDLIPRLNLKAENSKTDRSKPDFNIDDYIIVQLTTQKQNKNVTLVKCYHLTLFFVIF